MIFLPGRNSLSAMAFKNCQNFRLFTKISSLLESKSVGNRAEVQGWIKSKRKMKSLTFIDLSDGSTAEKLQVALPKNIPSNFDVGASVKIDGIIQTFGSKGDIEILAENVELIGPCDPNDVGYPFAPKTSYTMEYIRQHLQFRPRTNQFSSVLRIRSCASNAFRNYLSNKGFFEVNTPILTSFDCEGGGEVFSVRPDNKSLLKNMAKAGTPEDEAFFGTKAFLTVSGQMHLESAVRSLGQVYTFGPTFRAENSKSRLHLSEFNMLETEEVLSRNSIEPILSTIENMLRNVTQYILDSASADLQCIRKIQKQQKASGAHVLEYEVEPLDEENIKNTFLPCNPYTIMSYKEAVEILSRSSENFKVKPAFEEGLSKEHELYLVKHNNNKPIFVVDWPSHLKAFYMKKSKDMSTAAAVDLLMPVVGELCGGSVREDNVEILDSVMKQLGLQEKMSWYVDLRKFGNVTTGGFGMGYERYLQCLLSIPNIKDVMPYPRWPHSCQM
ncbi:putative asparagine--tRNA ligase, mitochondrial [Frankliniella fusca]|uniref:asparagine--tRNA ligase n=1 Tax=Frankliniella fusca TaxID=407009 RepID=A0AAE1LAU2_9NEOP|nr:putative asparagine--tRNA ligase, mitochondrial [Frankliniella fusca]